jgi:hypothetical protein
VFAVATCEVSKPSSRSAFRFVTLVVEDTVSGAVPVANVETKFVDETVPVKELKAAVYVRVP